MQVQRMAGLALCLVGLALLATGLGPAPAGGTDLLRFHIIAPSDLPGDQALKEAVRDALLPELAALARQAGSTADLGQELLGALPALEATARAQVAAAGRRDRVQLSLERQNHPARAYGLWVLPPGDYATLRVQIGAATGGNWWCVLFPPLCFADLTTGTQPATARTTLDAEELAALPRTARLYLLERRAQVQWGGFNLTPLPE